MLGGRGNGAPSTENEKAITKATPDRYHRIAFSRDL